MKKHVFFTRLLIFIISITMIFSLTSCSQQRKPIPTKQSSSKQGEQKKPPKELDKLSKAVDKIEKTLSEMHERSKKPLLIQQSEIAQQQGQGKGKQQQQPQQQGAGGGGGGQGKQQGGGGGSGGGSGGGAGGTSGGGQQGQQQPSQIQLVTPAEQLMQPQLQTQQMSQQVQQANTKQLEQVKKDVADLHTAWNAFEAKSENQLLMKDSISNFESGLNSLTKSVQSNNVYQSLLDVTQLYKYMPDFYVSYSSKTPPELGKLRFGAKKILLLTEKGKFTEAKDTYDYMADVWGAIRPKLPSDSKDKINQMEFSFTDLKNAIEAKDPVVVKAKADVMLKIIDELEKGSKSQSGQSSGGGSSGGSSGSGSSSGGSGGSDSSGGSGSSGSSGGSGGE